MSKPTLLAKANEYDRINLECAEIILRDPTRWGGHDSGPAMWARMVVDRLLPYSDDPARAGLQDVENERND